MSIDTLTDIEQIRDEFLTIGNTIGNKPLIYFDNAASSLKPKPVVDAIADYYNIYHSNVHRGVHSMSQKATDMFEQSRKVIADYLNAPETEEVIFTSGTTESLNLVAYSFGELLNPGDEIIISGSEHHSNIVPWQIICQRKKCQLKVINLNPNGTWNLDHFRELLSDKTKLISVAHTSNTMGIRNPIEEVITEGHKVGAAVCIDGAQATPHSTVDLQTMDADFFAFSGHKTYGPTGFGILYGKRKWLEKMPPFMGGGEMIETVSFEKTTYNKIPFKFEAGTPHIAGAIGMAKAIEYMNNLSWDFVKEQEDHLKNHMKNVLSNIDGLRIIGDVDHKASVFSFTIDGVHHYDLGTLLDQQGIAIRTGHHCTEPLMNFFGITGTARASLAFYNTTQEIDRFAEALETSIKMLR